MIHQLQVGATFGATVKVGDQVKKGQRLGTARDFKTPVLSPVDGRVKKVSFDADEHVFVVTIEEQIEG